MKKLLLTALAAALAAAGASAQVLEGVRFGALAGFTSSKAEIKNFDINSVSQYHIGVTAQLPLGAGFAVQPSLLYNMKGMSLGTKDATLSQFFKSLDAKVGYLELPVQVQWGPDLMYFRPYGFLEPFIGYQLSSKVQSGNQTINLEEFKDDLKKIEYGLGVGAGIEIWKLQVSAKYFWNFGDIYQTGDKARKTIEDALNNGSNFNGFALSVGFLF